MAVKTKSRKKTTTTGQYLLDRLQSYGVEHIFGLPGDYILHFDKLIENHEIHLINTTRENTAGYMADSYARLRGLGVACITYGVGINITNAVSQAFVESSPVVIISGAASKDEFMKCQRLHHLFNKSSSLPRDTTQLEIFEKITVAQAVLDDPKTAASEIDRVLGECLCQKKPVYIEIPRDQVDSEILPDHTEPTPHEKSDPEALQEVLSEITSILKECKRPMIWVGHEVHRYGLTDELLQFAEKYRIPIVSSLLGKTTVSEFHPLYMGIYQGKMSQEEVRDYVENCDAAFVLGVIFNDVDTGILTAKLEQENKVIATTESLKVRHHHYKNVFFTDLIKQLGHLDLNVRFRSDYPAYIDHKLPNFIAKKGKKTTATRLFECLQKHLTPENIVVSDIGDCLFGSAELMLDQECYLSNAYFASLGFGVPGAIGAQIAVPEKRVVGVVGDGAFQMTCMELSTAVRYHVDPVIILINNHGYGTERPLLEGKFNDILNWKYSKIPSILEGGVGIHVKTEEDFDKALTKAFSKRGEFYLIEVELDKTDYSPALQRFCKLVREKKND